MCSNERLKPRHANLLSAKLLLSYLSILIVPLAAILVIYNTAAGLMYTVQYERISAGLDETAREMERSLEEAANLGRHISTGGELSQLQRSLQQDGGKASYYQFYQLSLSFPNYTLFNSAIEDVYLFFNDQDYVIRLPTVEPATERGYLSIARNLAGSYREMARTLGGRYWDMGLLELRREGSVQREFGAVQTFPYGVRENPLGTILVVLNGAAIDERLRQSLVSDEALVLILNDEGGVVRQSAGSGCRLDAEKVAALLAGPEGESRELRLDGRRYALCAAQRGYLGYRLYSLVPRSVLLRRIGSIRIVILALCLVSVLTGLFTCVLLWVRKRRVVLRYSRFASEFGTAASKKSNIWEGLQAVMDSASQLYTTIRLQNGIVRASVLTRLLEGDYDDAAALGRDLRAAGISLEGTMYCAAAITVNRGYGAALSQSVNEFRLHIQGLVEQMLEAPHCACETEDLLLGVIFPVTSEESLATVLSQLRALRGRLAEEEHMEAYIGLGECVPERLGLAQSYSQARSVCEYLRFYNMRHVMQFRDMPPSNGVFYFPLELELQLTRAVEQGDADALQKTFGRLAVENFVTRHLTHEAQKQLLELVRYTAVRALPGQGGAVGEKLARAGSLEQLFVLLEQSMPEAAGRCRTQSAQRERERREQLRRLLETHCADPNFTIGRAAEELGIPESALYREFRQTFGVSFSEYLENLRIEKACELLRSQPLVKDVSARVGYNSDYSFRRAFKRVLGVTPSAYMQTLHTQDP